jgi:aspartate racemase
MSIESLDLNKAVSYLGLDHDERSWARFDAYHRAALKRLEANGADFALLASNTPHHRFAFIVEGIEIPVLSILDAVAKESARIGARQILILGTSLTMTSPTFRDGFAKYGVHAAGPRDEVARAMTGELIAELQRGECDGAAERVGKIARSSFVRRFGADCAVCLACTELPLAFRAQKALPTFECDGIVYVNSTAVHIDAAFQLAVEGSNVRGQT